MSVWRTASAVLSHRHDRLGFILQHKPHEIGIVNRQVENDAARPRADCSTASRANGAAGNRMDDLDR
jgi:hypothetical protein